MCRGELSLSPVDKWREPAVAVPQVVERPGDLPAALPGGHVDAGACAGETVRSIGQRLQPSRPGGAAGKADKHDLLGIFLDPLAEQVAEPQQQEHRARRHRAGEHGASARKGIVRRCAEGAIQNGIAYCGHSRMGAAYIDGFLIQLSVGGYGERRRPATEQWRQCVRQIARRDGIDGAVAVMVQPAIETRQRVGKKAHHVVSTAKHRVRRPHFPLDFVGRDAMLSEIADAFSLTVRPGVPFVV